MEILDGIVRVESNKCIGTGFVVSDEGLIVTCAHVLGTRRPEKATVIFQSGEKQETEVIAEWWRPTEAEDIAFLRLDDALPEGVQALPLGSCEGTSGHDIRAFGYPDTGEVEGVEGAGKALGLGARTQSGQPLLQLRSSEITAGFSGAPVWDTVRQRVIGMVVIAAKRDALGRLGETAFATPVETLQMICSALKVSEERPYFGLEAFTEADTKFFFGREQVIEKLANKLKDYLRFLLILGPSGSGKSSIIQAGLIPHLRQGEIAGIESEQWGFVIARPAENPFKQLAIRGLPGKSRDLTKRAQAWLKQHPEKKRLAVVIDQFEELFANCPETLQAEFVMQLTKLVRFSLRITVVLVMRDDYYSHFCKQRELVELLEESPGAIHVPSTLKQKELTALVEEPAHAVGWKFEEGLVETIVQDAMEASTLSEENERVGRCTVLPLLEFALTKLWEHRQDGMLTRKAYKKIGGITGGLRRWADDTFHRLKETQRSLAQRIFKDLVHLGDESQGIPDSRRRRSFKDLYRNKDEQKSVDQVVQYLVTQRLLVATHDTRSERRTVEIIHDALLREWAQLRKWLEEDRGFLKWHQKLEDITKEWVATSYDKGKLLRGGALTDAEQWLEGRKADLSQEQQAFIIASQEQRAQEEQFRREADQNKNAALARRLASQVETMVNQHREPLTKLHVDLECCVLLAVEAMQRFHCPETDNALRQSMVLLPFRLVTTLGYERHRKILAFSPNGQYLATSEGVWRIDSGELIPFEEIPDIQENNSLTLQQIFGDQVSEFIIPLETRAKKKAKRAIFNSDGHYLAIVSDQSPGLNTQVDIVEVWRITPKWQKVAILPLDGKVEALAFGPQGCILATAGGNTVKIWEADKARELLVRSYEGVAEAIALSLNECYLATVKEGYLEVWEVLHNNQRFCCPKKGMSAIALSLDGRYLATTSGVWDTTSHDKLISFDNDSAQVVNLCNAEEVALEGGSLDDEDEENDSEWVFSPIKNVAFSCDGRYLIANRERRLHDSVEVWEISSGRRIISVDYEESVKTIAFSPSSNFLAIHGSHGDLRIWDVTAFHQHLRLAHNYKVERLMLSLNGRYLAIVGERAWEYTAVEIWKTASWELVGRLSLENRSRIIAFSPDLRYFATSQRLGKTVEVWDIFDESQYHLTDFTDGWGVDNLAFSADGACLIAIRQNCAVGLWGADHNWEFIRSFSEEEKLLVRAAAFSPTMKYIAAAKWYDATDDTDTVAITILDLDDLSADPTHTLLIEYPKDDGIDSLVFSPDEACLVAKSKAGTVKVCEINNGYSVHSLAIDGVKSFVFSPDGRYMITANGTGSPDDARRRNIIFKREHTNSARIWETINWQQILSLPHISTVDAVAFSPDGNYLATANDDNSAGVWEIATGYQLIRLPHEQPVDAVAFSPDGRYLITSSECFWEHGRSETRMRLWRSEDLIDEACSRLNRSLTTEEKRLYLGDYHF